jgi:NADH-quinone oxidoreductase subunit F
LENAEGTEADLDLIAEVCQQIAGRSFCPLGDAASTPFPAALKHFRDEFVQATQIPANVSYDPVAATVFAGVSA